MVCVVCVGVVRGVCGRGVCGRGVCGCGGCGHGRCERWAWDVWAWDLRCGGAQEVLQLRGQPSTHRINERRWGAVVDENYLVKLGWGRDREGMGKGWGRDGDRMGKEWGRNGEGMGKGGNGCGCNVNGMWTVRPGGTGSSRALQAPGEATAAVWHEPCAEPARPSHGPRANHRRALHRRGICPRADPAWIP